MLKKKKLICLFILLLIVIGGVFAKVTIFNRNNFTSKEINNLISDMGLGWNLGNSLLCINAKDGFTNDKYYETSWGNPVVTKELINSVKKAGFKSIRIPVTYYNHVDKNGKIDEKWLDRVQEVVDFVIDNDMYCIINIHHDTGENRWINADPDKFDEMSERLRNLWEQISKKFKNYDEKKLIFEGFNEILSENKWENAGVEAYETVNKLNQVFVDTVRNTGEKNASRVLIVNTYGAKLEEDVISNFKLPNDSVKNKLIVGMHLYTTKEYIDSYIKRVKKYFIDKNIPVIIAEFAMANEKNCANEEERIEYVTKLLTEAYKLNIACYWWDDGNVENNKNNVTNLALFNRKTYEEYFPELIDKMTSIVNSNN